MATISDLHVAREYLRKNQFDDEVVAVWKVPEDIVAKKGKQVSGVLMGLEVAFKKNTNNGRD